MRFSERLFIIAGVLLFFWLSFTEINVRKSFSILIWFCVMLMVIAAGIAGFMTIEHYSFLNALYMTIITIATIGYQEVKPLSNAGKIFNIIYIIASFAVFTYALSRLTKFVISGQMALYFKNRKLMKAIEQISNHAIICGFGRNGQQAAQILLQHKTSFVVIDNNASHFTEWLTEHPSLVYIDGDATDDEVLLKAGIKKAKALLLTLPTDADNVFVVLSARSLNLHLQIISRAAQSSSVNKLKTAGANHVILPDKIGGSHMATLISKPDVIEFINHLWGDEANEINIESIDYNLLPASLQGKSIHHIIASEQTGVTCIGLKNHEGEFIINPSLKTLIQPHMKMIMLGTIEQLFHLKQRLQQTK